MMCHSLKTDSQPHAPRRRRWLRIPSFRVAAIGSASLVLIIVAWLFLDASSDDAADCLACAAGLCDVRRFEPRGWMYQPDMTWKDLLPRMAVWVALVSVGAIANVVALARVCFGRSGGRSVGSLLIVTGLVSAWLAFLVGFDELRWAALKARLSQRLTELTRLGHALNANWPEREGRSLPDHSEYEIYMKYGNPFEIERRGGHFVSSDTFDFIMHRRPNGTIQMPIDSWRGGARCTIEFVPEGAEPGSFTTFFYFLQRFELQGSVQLSDFVHLSWYTISIIPYD